MSRPEHIAPPEVFYNDSEADKYTHNTRVIDIQTTMTERCIELLNFPEPSPKLILDIGCGSALSGDVLTENGHAWVGLDISQSMLEVGRARGATAAGDMLRNDMGQGFGFRTGMFDGAISVSALQWLFYNDRKGHKSVQRLETFFTSLYRCLKRGARAALQFYPETEDQLEIVTALAKRCGFFGGLVVDFPNSTKAKKYYLVIFAGIEQAGAQPRLPRGLGTSNVAEPEDGETPNSVPFESKRARVKHPKSSKRVSVKSRQWILQKKEHQRKTSDSVRPDSKYTGRSRGPKF